MSEEKYGDPKMKQSETTLSQTPNDELDALYARWQDDRRSAQPTALREWLAGYSTCREELIRWTADAPLYEPADETAVSTEEEAQVLKIGRDILARKLAAYNASPDRPTVRDLYALAKERGLKTRDLAVALGIAPEIVAKLQSRLIRCATIPASFLELLASTLSAPVEQIRAYLEQPPALAQGALYKSDAAPQAGDAEEFTAAIRSCRAMTEPQKQRWLETGK